MKRIWIVLTGLSMCSAALAETFTVDTAHAGISFAVKHLMVSNVRGSYSTFEGTVEYDLDTRMLESIQGSIEVASIDTNNEKRDRHLRSEDFFNTAEFPKITFRSTAVEKTGDGTFRVKGRLNVLGVDHDVELPVTVNGPVDGQGGSRIIGLESSTVFNRRDLGITHSPSAVIGDEVKVLVEAEAVHK